MSLFYDIPIREVEQKVAERGYEIVASIGSSVTVTLRPVVALDPRVPWPTFDYTSHLDNTANNERRLAKYETVLRYVATLLAEYRVQHGLTP